MDLPQSPVHVTWADVNTERGRTYGSTHGHLGGGCWGWRSRRCPRGERSFDPPVHLMQNHLWLCVNVLFDTHRWSQERLLHPALIASHGEEVHEGPVLISAQMKCYLGRAEVAFINTVLSLSIFVQLLYTSVRQ